MKYICPGCKKRRSLDGGMLCPSCYDAAVAENAKTPSQEVISMPLAVWNDVVRALADDPLPRHSRHRRKEK